MIKISFTNDYKCISLFPYINIDWSDVTKYRGVTTCISIGWIFWEVYIDIIKR